MAYRDGALYSEEWLRNEVLYLHNLWRQGPHSSSVGNSNPSNNRFCPIPISLRPTSSLKISRDRNKYRSRRRKKEVVSEKEWPCDPDPDPNQAAPMGWPEPLQKLAPRPPSAEELAAAIATHAQKNAVEICRRFFSKKSIDSDSEEDGLTSDSEEDEDVYENAFDHFIGVFTKDNEFRRYYEANHVKGEFLCLVCEGIGKMKCRTYGDCGGLVQHCCSAAKIGHRDAHRSFAKAVCRVVGWNFDKLPMLVLDLGDTLGQILARDSSKLQEDSHAAEQSQNEVL